MTPTTPSSFSSRPARRLTVLMTVHDRARHSSLEVELLKRARRAKLAGATVFEGYEGYGDSGHIHRTHLMSDDAPLALVVVDERDRVDRFLHEVADLLHEVLAITDDVEILDL